MAASAASAVLRRSLRPVFNLRRFSFRSCHSVVLPRVLVGPALSRPVGPISVRFSSTKAVTAVDKVKRADVNLVRVLEDEIECAQEADEERVQEAVLPKDLPFEIIDNSGDQSILLRREFRGEKISVKVFIDYDENANLEAEDDDEDDDASETLQTSVSLVVTINKGDGPTLEFCCNLDEKVVEIESIALKRPESSDAESAYEGPEFSVLDGSLRKAFQRYLLARGINVSLCEFLREYMMGKDDKEYVGWLKNLKEFVEK